MKISTRLSAGFSLLILLFILCTDIAVHALREATAGMNDIVDVKMKRFALVVDMRNGVRDMAIAVRNLALLSDPAQMQPEWQRLKSQRETYIQKGVQLEKACPSTFPRRERPRWSGRCQQRASRFPR